MQSIGVQSLLKRYAGQLVNGCGDEQCTEIQCLTGRVNTAQEGRPVRRHTVVAAQAIAFAKVSGPDPGSHFCPYYDHNKRHNAAAAWQELDLKWDRSSIVQQLVRTPDIQLLFSPVTCPEPATPEFREVLEQHRQWLEGLLDPSAHTPGSGFVSNAELAHKLCSCMDWLLEKLPMPRIAQWHWVDTTVISKGNAYPQKLESLPTDGSYNTWLDVLDALDHDPYLRLLEGVCNVVTMRRSLENILTSANPHRTRDPSQELCAMIVCGLTKGTTSNDRLIVMIIFLKKLFARLWNLQPVIQRNHVCYGILEITSALHKKLESVSYPKMEVFKMQFISSHVSTIEIAEAWGAFNQPVHVLHYRFLFTTEQLHILFRTINHVTMRKAHLLVDQARKIREKVALVAERDFNEQMRYNETNCLLLNLSRGDVLRDTFDQMWHRRKGEMRRPLRVRLGAEEEFQVGQDLGGVQVEFFNLLCREVMDGDYGMFTTDPQTGCSSIKPGSLQPLRFFKHFGVLLALAMYNGITLPVTLPGVFYDFLVAQKPTIRNDTHILDDGWPEIAKHLRGLGKDEIEASEFAFDLGAHGVQLNVLASPPQDDPTLDSKRPLDAQSSSSTLKVLAHNPKSVDLESLKWPGWTIKPTEETAQAVTLASYPQYLQAKIHWHTYGAIKPQLLALLQGFTSADLFPPSTLACLFTAKTLKAYTEGMDYLDIDQLRAITTYDGYDPKDQYIKSFWRIVSSWSQERQKKLLKFVTAAERIPAGGAKLLVFVVKRAADDEKLPESHTCFGTLDLPEYESTKIMEEKLRIAVDYGAEGFGVA